MYTWLSRGLHHLSLCIKYLTSRWLTTRQPGFKWGCSYLPSITTLHYSTSGIFMPVLWAGKSDYSLMYHFAVLNCWRQLAYIDVSLGVILINPVAPHVPPFIHPAHSQTSISFPSIHACIASCHDTGSRTSCQSRSRLILWFRFVNSISLNLFT